MHSARFLAIALIYCFVTLVVLLASVFAPTANLCVSFMAYKTTAIFVLGIPGVAGTIAVFLTLLFLQDENLNNLANFTLMWMILAASYCYYAVLLTGGIAGSPLSSLIAIVPLLASTMLEAGLRIKLVKFSLVGVFLVGVLSLLQLFQAPATYPKNWGGPGGINHNSYIALGIMLLSLLFEWVVAKVNSTEEAHDADSSARPIVSHS